MYSTNHSKRKT